ncbi:protochlorophyllide-dependent translocon component 52, chloroplastic-like [Momordica charantia]|uniref:Protochlorophyllide-dependent translocon component 52, chloroplastic-like n=1 Tax=Momordica charantia TaxID=3673 RepID=A0A6J1D0M6_MOMCH|nr:protochlorophyllide-dependent translocon component 52, chloroplastic-like [Momordica charantia]
MQVKAAAMEVLKFSSAPLHSTAKVNKYRFRNQCFQVHLLPSTSSLTIHRHSRRFKLCANSSPTISTESANPLEVEPESERREERFDWYAQWYPVMPICDLDKRVPHGKKVMGIDVVVWWDRNESAWKVFDDACPHRLAPLSEGRIDQWGRLQCVYHGWCFNGSGGCKFIPQAPPDGPPVHTSKRACVAVYPSIVQNDILWFWPNSDPQYKDILVKKKPPYIPELDDPSYTKSMCNRDLPYGYEVLIENLMDPAHVPYAHYGIMGTQQPKNSEKADREGGKPIEIVVRDLDIYGFISNQTLGSSKFFAPCLYYSSFSLGPISKEKNPKLQDNGTLLSAENNTVTPNTSQKKGMLIFMCIPVSPGKSRVIFVFPRNFAVWMDRIIPRWMFHVGQNLILDSDLYLLHVEERKILDIGPLNWQKACFVPTKSDAIVVAFRRWLNKYSDGHVDWRGKFSGSLPPSPPKEQLMDRYWSHVVNCSSCRVACKGLNALEVVLQVISIASLGIFASTKQSLVSAAARNVMVAMAILCFAASRWLSHYIYKNFHFHDYNHALR